MAQESCSCHLNQARPITDIYWRIEAPDGVPLTGLHLALQHMEGETHTDAVYPVGTQPPGE